MRRILCLFAVLSVLLLAGCATRQRSDSLITTLNAYGSAVRWGGFQSALQFVDPEVREAHPLSQLDLARYQQVRVSDYDDGNGPTASGENEAKQIVQLRLINIHTQAERAVIDRQTWRYDEKEKRWWLTSGLPDITQD